jgi:hypothetical protein
MTRWSKTLAGFACALLLSQPGKFVGAQEIPTSNNPAVSRPTNANVQYLFPEQVSITAKQPATVDLHFRVKQGMHINSHTPHVKALIPTNLVLVEGPGVKVTSVDFPPGTDFAFVFSPKDKLNIYSGDFVLRAHLTVQPGDHLLQGGLRYQACDTNSCYPPKTIPVAVDVIAK